MVSLQDHDAPPPRPPLRGICTTGGAGLALIKDISMGPEEEEDAVMEEEEEEEVIVVKKEAHLPLTSGCSTNEILKVPCPVDMDDDLSGVLGTESRASPRTPHPLNPYNTACIQCFTSKVRCDRQVPCARCARLKLLCKPNPRKPGRPSRSHRWIQQRHHAHHHRHQHHEQNVPPKQEQQHQLVKPPRGPPPPPLPPAAGGATVAVAALSLASLSSFAGGVPGSGSTPFSQVCCTGHTATPAGHPLPSPSSSVVDTKMYLRPLSPIHIMPPVTALPQPRGATTITIDDHYHGSSSQQQPCPPPAAHLEQQLGSPSGPSPAHLNVAEEEWTEVCEMLSEFISPTPQGGGSRHGGHQHSHLGYLDLPTSPHGPGSSSSLLPPDFKPFVPPADCLPINTDLLPPNCHHYHHHHHPFVFPSRHHHHHAHVSSKGGDGAASSSPSLASPSTPTAAAATTTTTTTSSSSTTISPPSPPQGVAALSSSSSSSCHSPRAAIMHQVSLQCTISRQSSLLCSDTTSTTSPTPGSSSSSSGGGHDHDCQQQQQQAPQQDQGQGGSSSTKYHSTTTTTTSSSSSASIPPPAQPSSSAQPPLAAATCGSHNGSGSSSAGSTRRLHYHRPSTSHHHHHQQQHEGSGSTSGHKTPAAAASATSSSSTGATACGASPPTPAPSSSSPSSSSCGGGTMTSFDLMSRIVSKVAVGVISHNKAVAVLTFWHSWNLLLAQDTTHGLLYPLARTFRLELPAVLKPAASLNYFEAELAERAMLEKLDPLWSMDPSLAVCTVRWCRGQVRVTCSERFNAVFMTNAILEEGIMSRAMLPHLLWARLVNEGCQVEYWEAWIESTFEDKGCTATRNLLIRDRFNLEAWMSATLGSYASPCGWYSCMWLVLE